MGTVVSWLKERVPVRGEQLRELTNEPVPNHLKRWWFALGGTPAYLFVVQILTGILLAVYYQPAPSTAYESVRYITDQVSYGWYIRSVHKWAATLMIAAVILHQMRVYFTGGYRKPREVNWIIGMFLLLCTLGVGFTGYSLVYEQLSYWGATVGANIAESVPWVGPYIKKALLAGEVYNERTLSRFFILHAAILPVTMTLVLIRVIEAFKIVDLPNVLTNGGPGIVSESMTLHAYSTWRALDIGGSAAIAYMLLFIATFVCVAFVNLVRARPPAAAEPQR